MSRECFPIVISRDDPFFPPFTPQGEPSCMDFARSLLSQLKLGYRQQMNEVTSLVDASNIYGSNDCKATELRTFRNGQLKFQTRHGASMLPTQDDPECRSEANKCFFAGDARVNEQHGLTCIHTVWMREHNRIAEQLAAVNPHWSDERLYQETRRIVIALNQRITYNEFLPKVVGLKTMDKYSLLLGTQGHFDGYNSHCDPGISNAFATAAFRFGHTLVQSDFEMRDNSERAVGVIPLHTVFFRPDPLYNSPGYCDRLTMGMCAQNAGAFDTTITRDLANRLFEEDGKPKSGLDLAALNIQRGRDHGLPPYSEYRKRFGLTPAVRTFADLYGIMPNDSVNALAFVYRSVNDIDLFTGLMAEIPQPGALVGETTAEIIAEQFSRLRRCDRYWHETPAPTNPGGFSTAQLSELRRVSLSRVVCSMSPGMTKIQPQIFNMPDDYQNLPTDCSNLPDMDLKYWKERLSCEVNGLFFERGQTQRISPCISCVCTADLARCHSSRVSNCLDLVAEYGRQAVLTDDACLVQCHAFL